MTAKLLDVEESFQQKYVYSIVLLQKLSSSTAWLLHRPDTCMAWRYTRHMSLYENKGNRIYNVLIIRLRAIQLYLSNLFSYGFVF